MTAVAITGKDTLVLKQRVFTDLADGDASVIDFPNDLVSMKTGKNKNTIYAKNATGLNAELTLRVIKGSGDDKYLNGELAQITNDMPKYVLMKGSFVKKIGDGEGNVTSDTYNISGGIVKKPVGAKDNVEGDTEQAVSIYVISVALAERSLS